MPLEGLALALAVAAAVTVVATLVAIAGVLINRIAARQEGEGAVRR